MKVLASPYTTENKHKMLHTEAIGVPYIKNIWPCWCWENAMCSDVNLHFDQRIFQ